MTRKRPKIFARTKTVHVQEFVASMEYAVGAGLFIIGSVVFLPEVGTNFIGDCCFLLGSCLFLVGAIYDVLLIWDSPDRFSTHLANTIANCYVMGSSFYVCASLPYMYTTFQCEMDQYVVLTAAADVYIVGSILFSVGGVIDLYRAKYVRTYARSSRHRQAESNNTDKDRDSRDMDMPHPTNKSTPVIAETIDHDYRTDGQEKL